MNINKDDIKRMILESNYDLELLDQIIEHAITEGYKPLRAIGKKKAQEVIKRIIKNYKFINVKLGVDDEQ